MKGWERINPSNDPPFYIDRSAWSAHGNKELLIVSRKSLSKIIILLADISAGSFIVQHSIIKHCLTINPSLPWCQMYEAVLSRYGKAFDIEVQRMRKKGRFESFADILVSELVFLLNDSNKRTQFSIITIFE